MVKTFVSLLSGQASCMKLSERYQDKPLFIIVTFIIFNFQKIPIQNVFNVYNLKVIPIFQTASCDKLPNLHLDKYCILYCNNRVRIMVCLTV